MGGSQLITGELILKSSHPKLVRVYVAVRVRVRVKVMARLRVKTWVMAYGDELTVNISSGKSENRINEKCWEFIRICITYIEHVRDMTRYVLHLALG